MNQILSPPKRPALRYHGGKWKLGPWIVAHLPPHRVYVEPFGGGASVLLRKSRSYAEVYNDLSADLVNLFRVLRDPDSAARLEAQLRLTPFARDEFEDAYLPAQEPVERARRLLIRSYMGFGSDGHNAALRTGFRANSNRSGTTPAHDWMNWPDNIKQLTARLSGVVIENRDALAVMRRHDAPTTLHYVDPPYLPETRANRSRRGREKYHAYEHEMTKGDHADLLDGLRGLAGMVVLSGYPSAMYDSALFDWRRIDRAAHADGARDRTEVLWINPRAAQQLGGGLFKVSEAAA